MRRIVLSRWKFVLFLVLVLALLAGLGWWQRTPLLCWYCLRGLDSASDANRENWVKMVVLLDEAAVPGLLARFSRQNAQECKNAAAALAALTKKWGTSDLRTYDIASKVNASFDSFSASGKEAALVWSLAVADASSLPRPLRPSLCHLFEKAAQQKENGIKEQALALANILIERNPSPEFMTTCEKLIRQELKSSQDSQRVHAVHLTLHGVFQEKHDLLRQVVPLLKDKSAEVRRAAVLAVGTSPEVIAEEEMLPLLHDSDEEVRKLCEAALRSRGLHDDHILLGRLITDQRPTARLKIIRHLPRVHDVDPVLWLERLSKDSSEAVRAAAIRLAASSSQIDFRNRLMQMAQSDPSETVRQLARFYLTHN